MSKLEEDARRVFELRMEIGEGPILYPLIRFAEGEYVYTCTEDAWQEFKAGWEAAYEEYAPG
jgi:hypothetical protein